MAMRAALLGCLLLGAALPARPFFAQAVAGRDVFGEPLEERLPAGRPLLLMIANRGTREAAGDAGRRLAWELRDVRFATLVRVDLRGVPGLLHGIARAQMQDAWRDSIRQHAEHFRRNGAEPPPGSARQMTMAADPDGRIAQAAGLAKGFPRALGVVFDCRGREVARGTMPGDTERLVDAVRRACQGP